jgi:hypothetical protein
LIIGTIRPLLALAHIPSKGKIKRRREEEKEREKE